MKLDPLEIESGLRNLPGWALDGNAIVRRFEFKEFRTAFAFMTASALWAEKLDHHPDWSNSYSRVDVALTTHRAGGLTALDFTLAQEMNRIADGLVR